jgi:hypothetical protein
MTNSNSVSPNEPENLIPTCLILERHDYKWGTIEGKYKEQPRSHWHMWIVGNLFVCEWDWHVRSFQLGLTDGFCQMHHVTWSFVFSRPTHSSNLQNFGLIPVYLMTLSTSQLGQLCAVYEVIRRNTADQEAQIPCCNKVPINAIFMTGY